ncbi:MAG: pyridoxal phosphate-dependent aminotransferase [Methylobacteriaceae bacterium]|nr:pyridoxal phosphate-dependent aminotransferase [Methylobacteriaceae bacterium]
MQNARKVAPDDIFSALRAEAIAAPPSGIVEVFHYGRGRDGIIPLWVGEGDMPTPAFIQEAATRSFAAGETFYTNQRGLPELRETIAQYLARVYTLKSPLDGLYSPERFSVTIGGMHALQIALRLVAGAGDEAVVITPAWPNFRGALMVTGTGVTEVPLQFSGAGAGGQWDLDLDRLTDAITPRTRAIIVNSPSNPTGWTASPEELEAILALARRQGLWIIADEIYGRFFYNAGRAPSFRDLIDADDRIMFVQTFSKNWAMTGWRLGWLEAPSALGPIIENLVQYSTSGVPVPMQRAAITALEQGEAFVATQVARAKGNRDLLIEALAQTQQAHFAEPAGAFYFFCAFDTMLDTRTLAFRLVDDARVGVAPGTAFGAGGERFVRMCFARRRDDMVEASRRLSEWLTR